MLDLGYPPHSAMFARPGYRGTSLQQFAATFPDEEACIEHVFAARFAGHDLCDVCGANARWTPNVGRRMMRHRKCNKVIFPFSNTLLDHSKIPARLWFYLMLHMANSQESVNGYFVQRHLGLSLRAAQRMVRRIRLHLAMLDHQPTGHKNDVMHIRIEHVCGAWNPSKRALNRVNVLFMAQGKTIDFAVLDLTDPYRLRRFVRERLPADCRIVTDCHRTSRIARAYGKGKYSRVEFTPQEVFPDGDTICSFLLHFRRNWRNQHQNVHVGNLWLYLAEYRFRFNRRWESADIFPAMISQFPCMDDEVSRCMAHAYSDFG